MFDESHSKRLESNEPMNPVALMMGSLLILAGLGIGAWVLWQVHLLFTDPETTLIFGKLSREYLRNHELFTGVGLTFYAPEAIIYGVPLILLSLIVRLAQTCFTAGTKLIQGDWSLLSQQVQRQIQRINRQEEL